MNQPGDEFHMCHGKGICVVCGMTLPEVTPCPRPSREAFEKALDEVVELAAQRAIHGTVGLMQSYDHARAALLRLVFGDAE